MSLSLAVDPSVLGGAALPGTGSSLPRLDLCARHGVSHGRLDEYRDLRLCRYRYGLVWE